MTEFQQWLHDIYHELKNNHQNVEAENEAFAERFGIENFVHADRILCGVYGRFWYQVDDALEDLYNEQGLCLKTVFLTSISERVVV